jgi:hypothetical protein
MSPLGVRPTSTPALTGGLLAFAESLASRLLLPLSITRLLALSPLQLLLSVLAALADPVLRSQVVPNPVADTVVLVDPAVLAVNHPMLIKQVILLRYTD